MNTPQDPFESRLRQRMQSTPIDLPAASGPHAAADRAAERSRRRRTTFVAAAAIAVVGGVAAPALLGNDNDSGVNTQVAAPIDSNGVELDWQVHDDGLALVRSAEQGIDGFYALSTGPDTRYEDFPDGNIPRALYRWDGSAWQVVNSEADGGEHLAQVSERDGTLYALSTAADTGAPIGSVSTDGGATWASVPLGDVTPPSDAVDWQLAISFDLASTADTTVAVVNARFIVPGEALFADDIQQLESYSWRVTDAGVELFEMSLNGTDEEDRAVGLADPQGAPVSTTAPPAPTIAPTEAETLVRTISWAELGLADGSALEPSVTTYQVDGSDWTPSADVPTGIGGSEVLRATDSGILLQGWSTSDSGRAESTVFHTVDGSTWQQVPIPHNDGNGWSHVALAPNGDVLHVMETGDGPDVSVSADLGATWSPLDLTELLGERAEHDGVSMVGGYAGPLGVAVVANTFDADTGEPTGEILLFSTDLQSWSVTELDGLLPDGISYVSQVHVGNDKIIVQAAGPGDPDDGEPGPSATLVATPIR